MKKIFLAIILFLGFYHFYLAQKPRVVVLTDIEADPDDAQSMVRFLTYSNQWDIEGLIATTSIHQKDWAAIETIYDIVDAYGKVQPNFRFPDLIVITDYKIIK